jgi:hypothetical protein
LNAFRQQGLTVSHKLLKSWKWILIGLAATPAIRLYYIQEMIAALIMFSVLFVGVSMVVLILFLLDRVSQQIVVWTEPGIAWVLHSVVYMVEGMIARPVWAHAVPHRFRKEQLKEKN